VSGARVVLAVALALPRTRTSPPVTRPRMSPDKMETVRKPELLLALCVVVFVIVIVDAGVAPRRADASCIGNNLETDRTTIGIGEVLDVKGAGWVTKCEDVNPSGEAAVVSDISVVIVQGANVATLVRVDPSNDAEFDVRVTMPSSLQPGPATILALAPTGAARAVALELTPAPPGVDVDGAPVIVEGNASADGSAGLASWALVGLGLLAGAGAVGAAWAISGRRHEKR
jgi:hypothetical protein